MESTFLATLRATATTSSRASPAFDIREIFVAVRFSTFSTVSARSGHWVISAEMSALAE
jgi:hypothetical protein